MRHVMGVKPFDKNEFHWRFFFRFGACVKADAAALLAAFDDRGLRRTLLAFDATRLLVRSFRAISSPWLVTVPVANILRCAGCRQQFFHRPPMPSEPWGQETGCCTAYD
jgi:hypothetical protein